MSVTRSSTSGVMRQFRERLPSLFRSSTTSEYSALPQIGSVPPAMGHGHVHRYRGAAWNGAAMFFGTVGWMLVYWGKDLNSTRLDDNSHSYSVSWYILHSLMMGVGANLVAYPFVRYNHLALGDSVAEANAEFRKYFILCTIPDALYEPTADWLVAMVRYQSFTNFTFEEYADPAFNTLEVFGAFVLFGGAYGTIYYAGDHLIQRLAPDKNNENPESPLPDNASFTHRSLRKVRHMMMSNGGVAVLAALQYFIFYLTDDMFEVDLESGYNWKSFGIAFPQVLGMAALMALYTFAVDAASVLLQDLENKYYPSVEVEPLETTDEALDLTIDRLGTEDTLTESLIPASAREPESPVITPRPSLWYVPPVLPAVAAEDIFPETIQYRASA